MSVKNKLQTTAIVAVGAWIVYKYVANNFTPPSATDLFVRYVTDIVRDPDGSVNYGATLGITSPVVGSDPAGYNLSPDEKLILDYANNYGVQISWSFTDFGNNPEVDYNTTLRDTALAAGITPVTGWFGMFSRKDTLNALINTMTVPQL